MIGLENSSVRKILARETEFKPQSPLFKSRAWWYMFITAVLSGQRWLNPWPSLACQPDLVNTLQTNERCCLKKQTKKASTREWLPTLSLGLDAHSPAFNHSCFLSFFLSTCSGTRFCLFWADFTFRYLKHRKRRKGNFPLSFPHDPRKLEKLGESYRLCCPNKSQCDRIETCASEPVLAKSILYSITKWYCHIAPLSLESLYKRKRGEEPRPTPLHFIPDLPTKPARCAGTALRTRGSLKQSTFVEDSWLPNLHFDCSNPSPVINRKAQMEPV